MRKLQVLGSGCPKCKKLAEMTEEAARSMGIECEIEKVSDIREIMAFRVMVTPALVVDGEVKFAGKVPSLDEIKRAIE